MAKNATKTGNNHTVPAKKKGHAALHTALGILVIVAIGAAYLYFTFLSGGILSLALNAVQNPSSLGPAMSNKINSYPQLNISYTGSITRGSDPAFLVTFLKFHDDYRLQLSIPNFTSGKLYNITGIYIGNGSETLSYLCAGYQNTTPVCRPFSGSPSQLAEQLTGDIGLLGISGFQNTKIAGMPTPSYYNGSPCFKVSGSDAIQSAHGLLFNATSANVTFSACMSAKYYVPLYLNATITPSAGAVTYIHMRAIGIFPLSNESAVVELPGIINSST